MGAGESSLREKGLRHSRRKATDFYSLILRHGGAFVGKPSLMYVGGSSVMFDYLILERDISMDKLEKCCANLGFTGKRSFFGVTKEGLKPLYNTGDILSLARDCDNSRLLEVCVEASAATEGAHEGAVEAEGADVFEGDGAGEMFEGDDAVEAEGAGVFEGAGAMEDEVPRDFEDDVVLAESSLVDSDYKFEDESTEDDDDDVWESNVDKDIVDSDAEFEDEDVVCDLENDDFDERTISDEEGAPKEFSKFNKDVVYTPDFEIGMLFESRDLFRKAMTSHAINTKRSLYFLKIDNKRVYVRCRDEGCDWVCNALKVIGEETFQIRTYNPTHNCAPKFHVTNVSSTWLGQKHLSEFQSDPKRDVRCWRKEVMKTLNVNISKQQTYRAKAAALKILEGVPDLQYNKLWDYAEVLRSSNPGTTAVLDIDDEGKFSKFYVCFDACKQGFRSCRPFIGVDGCWLKGPRGGILLSAVGVDPGNSIFPLAFAVVSIENRETWEWFLVNLKSDLGIVSSDKYTFMSDKQKGLILALREVFPDAESRFCVRHMFNNLQTAGYRGLAFKVAVFKAAWSSTPGMFHESMKELRQLSEGAAEWLCDKHPSQWSLSYFSEHSKCDAILNNLCESFNACILDARDRPILTMFEWLRQWLMERFQSNRDAATKWKGRLTPRILVILRDTMEKITDCLPMKSTDRHYQIECPGGAQFAVDLVEKTCTCRKWQLSGIPCKHAVCAIVNQGEDPEMFVHECYSVETYKTVYDSPILPIPGQVEWAQTLFIPPMPPNFGKRCGRPKKLRKRDGNDTQETSKKGQKMLTKMKRQKGISKCKKCGEEGHTKAKCKKPDQPSTEQPSTEQPPTNQPPTKQPPTEIRPEQPSKKLRVWKKTTEVTVQPTSLGARGRGRSFRGRGAPTSGSGSNKSARGRGRSSRGRGTTTSGSGSNMGSRTLMDETDVEFEALLSQAQSGVQGPTPWEQLHMGTSSLIATSQPILPSASSRGGGMRPMFSTQSKEDASKNKMFITGKGKELAK